MDLTIRILLKLKNIHGFDIPLRELTKEILAIKNGKYSEVSSFNELFPYNEEEDIEGIYLEYCEFVNQTEALKARDNQVLIQVSEYYSRCKHDWNVIGGVEGSWVYECSNCKEIKTFDKGLAEYGMIGVSIIALLYFFYLLITSS